MSRLVEYKGSWFFQFFFLFGWNLEFVCSEMGTMVKQLEVCQIFSQRYNHILLDEKSSFRSLSVSISRVFI